MVEIGRNPPKSVENEGNRSRSVENGRNQSKMIKSCLKRGKVVEKDRNRSKTGNDTIKRGKIQAKSDKTEHKTESVEKSTVKSQQKVKPDKIEAKKIKKSKENKVEGLNLPFYKVVYKGGVDIPRWEYDPGKLCAASDLLKACHLPVELEHKAYWALKHANFDLKIAGDHRKVQINELNELCDQAYENSFIYKGKTKRLHDSKIKNRIFNIGDRVLLFNFRLKIFSDKLKSRWSGPFTISQVYPYATVELSEPDGPNFKVNGHRVKYYFGEDVPKLVVPDLQNFSKDH
nr:reverse transcriptase domain-containing protein [Tanacetum cinerariifolium]